MPQLSSLAEWSKKHICAVFESSNSEESLKAIQETFSNSINATLNGKQLGYDDIVHMVIAMRNEAPKGLKVEWLTAVESTSSSNYRDGFLGGMYIIHGIHRNLPGLPGTVEFSRHKAVVVQIQSQSTDLLIDSRKIVHLSFVASDFPL
ncbi:hypothetical protein BJ912DRAFT_859650 [Pholiota molesta]|nr:hypothetical protein BJ912DRAFT_859650 [Pholiota molesta]